jgi:Family of unknown function (DUF6152)
MIRKPRALATALLLALAALPAGAHHSFAMFDLEKDVTLQGVVREFQWTNPHVWLQLLVTDEKGNTVEWSLEGGAPGMFIRTGWTRKTLQPDDKISVVIHPLRNGKPGGSLVTVTLPDGRTLKPGGVALRPGEEASQ